VIADISPNFAVVYKLALQFSYGFLNFREQGSGVSAQQWCRRKVLGCLGRAQANDVHLTAMSRGASAH
jgi:hypothetical protein